MSNLPLVTVIVVNFNGISFIGDCIESVLSSDYSSFGVVVVDNASTDGSYEYIKDKFRQDKKLKLIRMEKQLFFTGGSNLGAINSNGDKLIFLNSDTVVDKNWIKELVSFAQDHPNCLVQPKILSFQEKNTIDNVGGIYDFWGLGRGKGRGEHDNGQYDQDYPVDYVNGTSFMIDKRKFYDLGGFDEWYKYHYEDVDLCLRAKNQDIASWYCYKSVIYHKGSLTVKSQLKAEELQYNIRKNRLRTVVKNFTGFQRIVKTSGLLLVYFLLTIKDLIKLRPNNAYLTIVSVIAVVNYEIKVFVDKFRLWELKRYIHKKHFSLLDLGCGDGTFLNLAIKDGVEALGIDTVPRVHNKIVCAMIENYKPLPTKKKFDVVTLYHVLEHLQKPVVTLNKIIALVKPNGWLIIEVPLIGNLSEKFLKGSYFVCQDKSHQTFFTQKEFVRLLNQVGLVIRKKGFALFEFPFTVVTTAFRKNLFYGLVGMIVFLPLKILSLLGLNNEILRIYCRQK